MRSTLNKNTTIILLIAVVVIATWSLLFFSLAGSGKNYDWPAWNAWISVWREALTLGEIPYYATYFQSESSDGAALNWGNNFFATPFIVMSPAVLLSTIFPSEYIGFINFMVFLVISLFYFKSISIDLNLDYISMATLAILWFFAGFIVYRIAAGHIQLSGYLLALPYIYINYKMLNEECKHILKSRTYEIYMLLLVTSLSAGFHIIQQWAILSIVILFKNKKALISIAKSYLLLIPSIMYFLLPNILFGNYIDDASRFMQNGTLKWIENDLIVQYSHLAWSEVISFFQHVMGAINRVVNTIIFTVWPVNLNIDGSWENSLNIGFTGTALIIWSLTSNKKSLMPVLTKKLVLFNALTIVILAYYGLEIIFNIFIHPLGIPAMDRLSIRIIIYALSILILYSVSVIQNSISPKWRIIILATLIIEMTYNLHMLTGQTSTLNISFHDTIQPCINTCIEGIQINKNYITIVNVSIIISFISYIIIGFNYIHFRRKTR